MSKKTMTQEEMQARLEETCAIVQERVRQQLASEKNDRLIRNARKRQELWHVFITLLIGCGTMFLAAIIVTLVSYVIYIPREIQVLLVMGLWFWILMKWCKNK